MKQNRINRNIIRSGLYLSVFFIGLHSMLLGIFIYFFTEKFYNLFFSLSPQNIFFVRQSGVFLFLLGVVYTFPLIRLNQRIYLIKYIIFTKCIAIIFLLINAKISMSPEAIYLAALGDGIMVFVLFSLLFTYLNMRQKRYSNSSLLR
ncbi:MAG: hypothetical protein OEM02_14060 [Desulfobulbaceae bacterium]|nr:hypothetical protein [Desulfobulbaceae bacterium]